jgi:hypothetical protein
MLPAIGSPAIHQASCANCAIDSILDQRGAMRHSLTDIGAVERQYPEDLMFRNGFEPP